MIQDATVIMHVGDTQLPFSEYLYRVVLHLLAFAAVAVSTRLWVGVIDRMTTEPASGADFEERDS